LVEPVQLDEGGRAHRCRIQADALSRCARGELVEERERVCWDEPKEELRTP